MQTKKKAPASNLICNELSHCVFLSPEFVVVEQTVLIPDLFQWNVCVFLFLLSHLTLTYVSLNDKKKKTASNLFNEPVL